MCLTGVLSHGDVAYVFTDNNGTKLNVDRNQCKTKEALIDAVELIQDIGSKVEILRNGAALAWASNKPIIKNAIIEAVETRERTDNPEAYQGVDGLIGFLVTPNPLRIYAFEDEGLREIKKVGGVIASWMTVPHFSDVIREELGKSLKGVRLDVIDPNTLWVMLTEALEAINDRCPMVGCKLHLVRIDSTGAKLIE